MRELSIGVQDFEIIRRENLLYVDKTDRLLDLVKNGRRYFLSRPRRFGKSLTLSTLEAMFRGKAELFKGLSSEDWVKEQANSPSPVISMDMSGFDEPETGEELNQSLITELEEVAEINELEVKSVSNCGKMLKNVIRSLYERSGYVVFLIDEYDSPILNHISDLGRAEEMRGVLRSFYKVLKSCDKYLRFLFLTGISKFSKVGVFSALNNLEDISMDEEYGSVAGYTQEELEFYFSDRIDDVAFRVGITREELLKRLKNYYDGFSFDGVAKIYNPFSIMQCLKKAAFGNYWYESGSPSFIVEWMKDHQIQEPEEYRHVRVRSDFTSSQEIERADPKSFLYQSGYLTIEEKEGNILTLDYPNREVLDSLSGMYLELVYRMENFVSLGAEIWRALEKGDILEVVRLYNIALSEIPYDDYSRNRNEYWYRSMFVMLLRGAGIIVYAEVHTYQGRSDVVIQFTNHIVVLEFKFASRSSEVREKRLEGERQIRERGYSKGYGVEGHNVTPAVLVADDEKKLVICKL